MSGLVEAKNNNHLKIDLVKKIQSLIENDNAYGSNVEILSFKIADNIAGKFRDTWSKRIFIYSITDNRLGYRPAINTKATDKIEQVSKNLDNFSSGYNAILPVAKLDSSRHVKPRCTAISFSCGKICLDINKICWVDDTTQKNKTRKNDITSRQKRLLK